MPTKHQKEVYKTAQDFIDAIFDATRELNDAEYIEFLETISGVLDDAVRVKRSEKEF